MIEFDSKVKIGEVNFTNYNFRLEFHTYEPEYRKELEEVANKYGLHIEEDEHFYYDVAESFARDLYVFPPEFLKELESLGWKLTFIINGSNFNNHIRTRIFGVKGELAEHGR